MLYRTRKSFLPTSQHTFVLIFMRHRVFNKQLMGAIEGDSIPSKAVPEMIEWWRKGLFPFDKFVKFFPAQQMEEAIEEMKSGVVVKPVLVW